ASRNGTRCYRRDIAVKASGIRLAIDRRMRSFIIALVLTSCRAPEATSEHSEEALACDYECWAGGSGFTGWTGCCAGLACRRQGHCCELIGVDRQTGGTIVQKQDDGTCRVVGFGTLSAVPSCPSDVCGWAVSSVGCCDLNTDGGCTWQAGCGMLGVTRWC